jgi:PAP2 superfamily
VPELRPQWQLSVATAVVLVLLFAVGRRSSRPRLRAAAAFGREFALVMALLAVWQLVGGSVLSRQTGAFERARGVWQVERWAHLWSEVDLQRLVLPHPPLVEAADRYYAYVHLNGMAVFLVAMWWRRRPLYPRLRLTVVLATLACLLVQVVPVAPPRLLPELGFVDTALTRGESVYGSFGTGLSNQLSAMPSVHVAWATIAAVFLWRAGGRLPRAVGLVHLTLTVTAVVVTANHWWLDGVVGAVLVGAAVSASDAWYGRRPAPALSGADPAPAPL